MAGRVRGAAASLSDEGWVCGVRLQLHAFGCWCPHLLRLLPSPPQVDVNHDGLIDFNEWLAAMVDWRSVRRLAVCMMPGA